MGAIIGFSVWIWAAAEVGGTDLCFLPIYDFVTMRRLGALQPGWHEYRLTDEIPPGWNPAQPTQLYLHVPGPAHLLVGACRWRIVEPAHDVIFVESFEPRGGVGHVRWDGLTGRWWKRDEIHLVGESPDGRRELEGLARCSVAAPPRAYAFGGFIQAAPGQTAQLIFGLRDAAHYHALEVREPTPDEEPRAAPWVQLRLLRVDGGPAQELAAARFQRVGFSARTLDVRVRGRVLDVYRGRERALHLDDYRPHGDGLALGYRGPGIHYFDNLMLREHPAR